MKLKQENTAIADKSRDAYVQTTFACVTVHNGLKQYFWSTAEVVTSCLYRLGLYYLYRHVGYMRCVLK